MKNNFILGAAIISLASLSLAGSVSAMTQKIITTKTVPSKVVQVASSTKSLHVIKTNPIKVNPEKINQASSTQNHIANMQQRGQDMVSQRIVSISMLISRVQNMSKLSDADKVSILTPLRSEISTLINMRNTLSSTTSTSTLKTQIDAITKANRVYTLVEPQANIIAASDRIIAIATSLNTIYAKVNSRLASNSGAGSDATTGASLSDFTSKISDAMSQASSSIAEVSGLKPDNGDKNVAASNTAALKDAKAKISVAQSDMIAAQGDIKSVAIKILSEK